MPVGNRSKVFGVNAKMARFHFFDLCREDAGVDRFFFGEPLLWLWRLILKSFPLSETENSTVGGKKNAGRGYLTGREA